MPDTNERLELAARAIQLEELIGKAKAAKECQAGIAQGLLLSMATGNGNSRMKPEWKAHVKAIRAACAAAFPDGSVGVELDTLHDPDILQIAVEGDDKVKEPEAKLAYRKLHYLSRQIDQEAAKLIGFLERALGSVRSEIATGV